MISSEECFVVWAPDDARWSAWAKPAAFVTSVGFLPIEPPIAMPTWRLPGMPETWTQAAVVVDLPGAEAVQAGLLLAAAGFRPVPLFNGTHGPRPVVDVEPIVTELGRSAAWLEALRLPTDARPAFLLDSRRSGAAPPSPGDYDNRWIALPQDFPSAALLRSHAITEAILIQRGRGAAAVDLTHVLLRWQQAGLRIRLVDLETSAVEDDVRVEEPSGFRRAWYAAIALLGLRRNNVGGFGSTIPEQTASGRAGFYG